MIKYVDINDHVLQAYYRYNGQFYTIDSSRLSGFNQNEAQDRWEIICIRVYEFIPCTCAPHHGVGEDGCSCVAHGGSGPSIISYMDCFETGPFVNTQSGSNPQPPPYTPDPQQTNTGGGNNTYQNNATCLLDNIASFDSEYGTSLLDDYEVIAEGVLLDVLEATLRIRPA